MEPGASHGCDDDRLSACPECVQRKIRALEPGDTLVLRPGTYCRPITAVGLRGSASNRIAIRGQSKGWDGEEGGPQQEPNASAEAVLTTGIDAEGFRREANRLARKKQAAGGSPGLYYIADEAMLFLRDCQHVTVENLYFDRCWPTAVYLDNCQDIPSDPASSAGVPMPSARRVSTPAIWSWRTAAGSKTRATRAATGRMSCGSGSTAISMRKTLRMAMAGYRSKRTGASLTAISSSAGGSPGS